MVTHLDTEPRLKRGALPPLPYTVLSFELTKHRDGCVNLYEPCVLYVGRAHRYPPKTPFYIFFQQIYLQNFLNMLHTLRFSLFKIPFIS
jgi:hypothetical protein